MILVLASVASAACGSRSHNLLSESGGAFVARGVLDAAGVFGSGCPERTLSSSRNVMECGSGAGGLTPGVEMANLGVSVARAALGAAMWAVAQSGAQAQLDRAARHPTRGLDEALSLSRANLGLEAPPPARARCEEQVCRAALMSRLALGSGKP